MQPKKAGEGLAGFARSQFERLSQHQSQIACGHLKQVTFAHSSKPRDFKIREVTPDIYEFDGRSIEAVLGRVRKKRPTEFSTMAGSNDRLMVLICSKCFVNLGESAWRRSPISLAWHHARK